MTEDNRMHAQPTTGNIWIQEHSEGADLRQNKSTPDTESERLLKFNGEFLVYDIHADSITSSRNMSQTVEKYPIVEQSPSKFLDRDPEADDFQQLGLISSFLSTDTSLVKSSWRSKLREVANRQ